MIGITTNDPESPNLCRCISTITSSSDCCTTTITTSSFCSACGKLKPYIVSNSKSEPPVEPLRILNRKEKRKAKALARTSPRRKIGIQRH